MTNDEQDQYLALTQEIETLKARLDQAIKSKQQLATALYARHGKHAVYLIGEQYWIIARAKNGTHYFCPRVRWPSEARAAKKEKQRLDRIARLQQRQQPVNKVEVTACLSRMGAKPAVPALDGSQDLDDESKRHLPIVGNVDEPNQVEPRLLKIQEPPAEESHLEEMLRSLASP